MMADLDLACVRAFLAVHEARGFTRAAQRLNRTQSAVSMQVRRLEEALGATLIADRKRVMLTDAGERFLEPARALVQLNDEALSRVRGVDVVGRVRIGAPDDYAASFLPPVLRRLAASHPGVEIEVRCEISADLVARVDAGRIDLALITRLPGLDRGTVIRREELVWVCGDGAAAEARPLPLALFPNGCLFRETALSRLDKAGVPARLAYVSPSLAGLTGAVAEGLAVTVLARSTVPQGLRIVAPGVLPALPDAEIATYALDESPAVEAVRAAMAETLARPGPRAAA